jgi:hypothetical protein
LLLQGVKIWYILRHAKTVFFALFKAKLAPMKTHAQMCTHVRTTAQTYPLPQEI